MGLLHAVVLAIIQALTEFLPISSSGHLALAGYFLGWGYQGITFDLALHAGTLIAVICYFHKDLVQLAKGVSMPKRGEPLGKEQLLLLGLALATVPAAIAGIAMGDELATHLRHPWLIATNLIAFGLLLYWADAKNRHATRQDVSLRDALLIGCAQALALIPGTSRSGITLTAAMALGYERQTAARYSFLLSIPITFLACAHGAYMLIKAPEGPHWPELAVGIAVSAVAGIACIHFMLGVLKKLGTAPFVAYRIFLGLAVFAWYWMH